MRGRARDARVLVVVVNFNGGEFLLRALTLLGHQTFQDFEVVVVDNGSHDGSADRAEREFPDATVIRAGANLGFAAANNLGMRASPGTEFVALLNPDAYPEPHWLDELVGAARRHPDGAAFGSRMFRDEERSVLDGVGDVYHVTGLTWRAGHTAPATGAFQEEREIFSACAAAVLYRTSALVEVGGFDERFFMYLEDVDLGFRLRLKGWSAWYVPTAQVQHLGSAIVGERSDMQIYLGHRNLVWTYVQDMPGDLLWRYAPAHLLLNAYSLVALTLQGHGRPILRAKVDAVRGLPAAWSRRKAVQAGKTADSQAVLDQMSRGLPRRGRRREGQRSIGWSRQSPASRKHPQSDM